MIEALVRSVSPNKFGEPEVTYVTSTLLGQLASLFRIHLEREKLCFIDKMTKTLFMHNIRPLSLPEYIINSANRTPATIRLGGHIS